MKYCVSKKDKKNLQIKQSRHRKYERMLKNSSINSAWRVKSCKFEF